MINNQYISIGVGGEDTVAKENKPNFKKKEPYSKTTIVKNLQNILI